MEKLTKENYQEHVLNYYKPYSTDLLKVRESLNKTANLHGYEDIPEITTRCFNANTRAIKFFQKYNMNYYDNSLTNEDRPIMIAVEHFLYEKMIDAKLLINDYMQELNNVSDKVVKTTEFKIFKKYGVQLFRLFGIQPNYSKYYTHLSHYMEDYFKIVDEVSNFEIEERLEDVIIYYLPFLYKQVLKTKYSNNVSVNLLFVNRLFMNRVYCITIALEKIGRKELT